MLRANDLWHAATAKQSSRSALGSVLRARQLQAIRYGARPDFVRSMQSRRAAALHGLDRAVRQVETRLRGLRLAVIAAGGRALRRDVMTAQLEVELPGTKLAQISARSDVQAIDQAPPLRQLGLATSTAAVGAPSFWDAGLAGGSGASDVNPTDLAILGDKIQEDHPAFTGIRFQRPSDAPVGTPCGATDNGCEHGTEVASMAISRGASNCALCGADDGSKKGIAPGLDSVLDADAMSLSVDNAAWALGVTSFGVVGAVDPAEVLSDCHGAPAAFEDSASLQSTDKFISAFGSLIAYPAGNEGPGRSINYPCSAYDSLCVGGFAPNATVDAADDTIPDFVSRGPTPGGRKKPDIVAVASSEFANQHWQRDGNLWSGGSGTSLAAPQGAAAAALLAGSGITAPIAQKAILIDSARQGRSTPGSAMGTQTGWQPDWAWGALDLSEALRERRNFYTSEVAGGDAHFYRATLEAPGDRATLVWNRRAVGCIRPGCGTSALTLTDLDLEQIDPASGAVVTSSRSKIDNVEQVRSPATGSTIYKVKAASTVDGLPAEPYALAATRQVTPLANPKPAVNVSVDHSIVRAGDDVHVMATVTNPSHDLSAESANVTLDLPPAAALAPGSADPTVELGTLAPAGSSGSSAVVSWTVRATGDGPRPLTVTTSASRYGETFASNDTAWLTVDGTPPTVTITAPTGRVTDPNIPVRWSGVDASSALRTFDVQVSENGGPYAQWLTGTTETAASFPANRGRRYRFRARATDLLDWTSGFAESGEVTVDPPPTTDHRRDPHLVLAKVVRRGRVIRLRGRVVSYSRISVAVQLTGRAGRTFICRRVSIRETAGRLRADLRLPRGIRALRDATVTLRFTGNENYVGASVARRFARL